MLLETVLQLVQLGAKKNVRFWKTEYDTNRKILVPVLTELIDGLPEESEPKSHLLRLLDVLQEEDPNEFELAQLLLYIAEVLVTEAPPEQSDLAHEYLQRSKEFYERAQTAELHRRERESLKDKMSTAEQQEYDVRLFQNEGMMYCLEFYLALYKAIVDAPTVEAKRQYIEYVTVDLGFGDVPGLWIDMKHDEVLTKFIYKILNDNIRMQLVNAYETAKEEIMKVDVVCTSSDHCDATYHSASVDSVVQSFRTLVSHIMVAFQAVGVERLSSLFFAPYGNKPNISDIVL